MSSSELGSLSRILPNLLLGDVFAARQLDLLQQNKITHILPIGMNLKPTFPELFVYFNKEIDVLDKEGEDLLSYFDECCEFIEMGCKIGTILVYCVSGVSRSAAVVISYLMKKFGYSFEESLKRVKSVRSIVNVNPSFVDQLLLYERLHYVVDPHNCEYVKFKEKIEIQKKKNRSEIIYLHYYPLSLAHAQSKQEQTESNIHFLSLQKSNEQNPLLLQY